MNDNSNGVNVGNKILSWILLALEILIMLVKLFLHIGQSIFKVIVPPEEASVSGEKVLITGTGHGIGKELARQYGLLGAEVVCVDINAETNQCTVDELKNMGIKATGFQCDVSKNENVMELHKNVKATVGDITILVNNAGIMPTKYWKDHTEEDVTRIFEINVFAHFWLLKAFLPSMLEKDRGHVVGISSIAGLIGFPNVSAYCSSKFAVRGLMETLIEEFRQRGSNVKFTTVYPFVTDTGLCKKMKVRFPNIFSVNSPEYTASQIIKYQRRGYWEATIPEFLKAVHDVGRTFPIKSQMNIIDFLDSGLLVE